MTFQRLAKANIVCRAEPEIASSSMASLFMLLSTLLFPQTES